MKRDLHNALKRFVTIFPVSQLDCGTHFYFDLDPDQMEIDHDQDCD